MKKRGQAQNNSEKSRTAGGSKKHVRKKGRGGAEEGLGGTRCDICFNITKGICTKKGQEAGKEPGQPAYECMEERPDHDLKRGKNAVEDKEKAAAGMKKTGIQNVRDRQKTMRNRTKFFTSSACSERTKKEWRKRVVEGYARTKNARYGQ